MYTGMKKLDTIEKRIEQEAFIAMASIPFLEYNKKGGLAHESTYISEGLIRGDINDPKIKSVRIYTGFHGDILCDLIKNGEFYHNPISVKNHNTLTHDPYKNNNIINLEIVDDLSDNTLEMDYDHIGVEVYHLDQMPRYTPSCQSERLRSAEGIKELFDEIKNIDPNSEYWKKRFDKDTITRVQNSKLDEIVHRFY